VKISGFLDLSSCILPSLIYFAMVSTIILTSKVLPTFHIFKKIKYHYTMNIKTASPPSYLNVEGG